MRGRARTWGLPLGTAVSQDSRLLSCLAVSPTFFWRRHATACAPQKGGTGEGWVGKGVSNGVLDWNAVSRGRHPVLPPCTRLLAPPLHVLRFHCLASS